MDVLLVSDDEDALSEFRDGWHSRRPATTLVNAAGHDLLSTHIPELHLLDGRTDLGIADGAVRPLDTTDHLGSALEAIIDAAEGGEVTVLAGASLAHDGGRAAFSRLSERHRCLLTAVAPRITVGAEEDAPLLGLHSRGAALAHDAIVAAADVQEREADIGRFVAELSRRLHANPRIARRAGSAAAGGLAYVLAAAGARLLDLPRALAHHFAWDQAVASCDLAVVLSTQGNPARLLSGLAGTVGEIARREATPLALVSEVGFLSRRELAAAGITDCYLRQGRSFEAVGRSLASTWHGAHLG